LAIFLFFEKPLQVDFADGSGGGIKASAHLDLLAHLLNSSGCVFLKASIGLSIPMPGVPWAQVMSAGNG